MWLRCRVALPDEKYVVLTVGDASTRARLVPLSDGRLGVCPDQDIEADGRAAGENYIARLTTEQVADIERFINTEAKRYGVGIDRPVRVDLYPEVHDRPPSHAPD